MLNANRFLVVPVLVVGALLWVGNLWWVGGLAAPSQAAQVTNPIVVTTTLDHMGGNGQCSLREALHNANFNTQFVDAPGECPAGSDSALDVIVLVSGEMYTLMLPGSGNDVGDLDVLDDVRFVVDGEMPATIQMGVVGQRVMEIHGAAVEIENITLRGGSTADNGGGILNQNGTLTLTNVSLLNNLANAGGGLYNANGTVTISNSQIILNQGALGGGGLVNSGAESHLRLQGSMVRVNSSEGGSGGGIVNGEGVLIIEADSAVNLNTAFMTGGGIYSSEGGQVAIYHSMVQGNTAQEDKGGGVYVAGEGSLLVVAHSTIRDNKAVKENAGLGGGVMLYEGATAEFSQSNLIENEAFTGGGLLVHQATATLSQSSILSNTAEAGAGLTNHEGTVQATAVQVQGNISAEAGGGIYNINGQLSLSDSTIEANTSTNQMGGGIVNTMGVLTMTHTAVRDNHAQGGGGIANLNGQLTLDNSTVIDNIAHQGYAGGLGNSGGVVVIRNSSELRGNSALQGGGAIYNLSGGQLTLHEVVIEENVSNGHAGGILNEGNQTHMLATRVHFSKNMAPMGNGGALHTSDNSSATIHESAFYENGAVYGAAVYASDTSGTVTLNRTAVYSNTATQQGGGVWAGNVIALNNSTVSGNSAVSGGGVMVSSTGSATLIHVTLANNSLFDLFKNGDATLTMQNSIVSTPGVNSCVVIATSIFSLGGNVADDETCTGLEDATDQVGVAVLLAPLSDYGGQTLTHALLEGSPAVGAAVVEGCTAEPINGRDQRGFGRGTAVCDSGSFELGGTLAIYLPLIVR